MKKILAFSFIILMSFNLDAQELIDRVVAKVGGENILLSDIEDQYAYRKTQGVESSKCAILEDILAQKLIVYQAKLDSVEVTDAEVDQQLDYRFNHILRQMNGDEELFKEYYGSSIAQMKEISRDDQKQQILAQRMQQQLIQDVEITPKEVKDFFNKIPKDSIPYLDSEVELGELVMKPILSKEEKKAAKDKLQNILDKINNGEADFEKMALDYSQDPGSGSRGGDLGFAKRGTYVPEFEETVYSLDKGQISDIVETEFGYHIIKLVERRGNSVRAKHILIKPEVTQASIDRTMHRLDSIKTLVEVDSMSFAQAVRKFGYNKSQSYNNNGKMKNPKTGNNFFETDNLDPDIYFEIVDLDIDQITKPLAYTSARGEKEFRLVQLQSMTKPHQANLQQDYDKISNFAKESKKAEYFNKWIEEKMKTSFIKIDNSYDCDNIRQLIN